MNKTKLQEICQRKRWSLPKYSVEKYGLDHDPHFQASVTVNGLTFTSGDQCKSSKDAQEEAALRAFNLFSAPEFTPSEAPIPSGRSRLRGNDVTLETIEIVTSSMTSDLNKEFPTPGASQPKSQEMNQIPHMIGNARLVKDNGRCKDMQHSYKNQLQYYAQKSNISVPAYSCEQEGPPHASCFKGVVRVGERTYESQELFPTRKDAEHMAAKVALMSLSQNGIQEDESIYKNLLQELAQKECYGLPSYNTLSFGEAHTPIFRSTVKVEEDTFTGREAKTKKQAEMSAARIAYMTLKERIARQTAIAHQGKGNGNGNPEFLSFGLHSEQTMDPISNFHAELSPIPNEEQEAAITGNE